MNIGKYKYYIYLYIVYRIYTLSQVHSQNLVKGEGVGGGDVQEIWKRETNVDTKDLPIELTYN